MQVTIHDKKITLRAVLVGLLHSLFTALSSFIFLIEETSITIISHVINGFKLFFFILLFDRCHSFHIHFSRIRSLKLRSSRLRTLRLRHFGRFDIILLRFFTPFLFQLVFKVWFFFLIELVGAHGAHWVVNVSSHF